MKKNKSYVFWTPSEFDSNEYREKIVSAITEYFDENESKISCVEFSKSS